MHTRTNKHTRIYPAHRFHIVYQKPQTKGRAFTMWVILSYFDIGVLIKYCYKLILFGIEK
jgi:hypothetical protein